MARPSRKWQLLGVVGALALVVAVCLLVPGPETKGSKKPDLPKPTDKSAKTPFTPMPAVSLPVKLNNGVGRVGDPGAKVKVEVFVPGHGGCGNETADFIYRVYEANKEQMYVVFVDFESPGGAAYQGKKGLHCAGVVINGKQKVKIPGQEGRTQTVDLGSNLGDRWTEKQFFAALDAEFKAAYGKPANHRLPPPKHRPGAIVPAYGDEKSAPKTAKVKTPS